MNKKDGNKMKSKKKSDKQTIQRTIFYNMVMSSICFIILLFIGTTYLFLNRMWELENKNTVQQLRYIASQLEFYMKTVDNYSKTIITNTEIQKYMIDCNKNEELMKDYFQKQDIQKQIKQIIQSTDFIHSVTLYTSKGELIITTEPYSKVDNLKNCNMYSEWIIDKRRNLSDHKQMVKTLSKLQPFYSILSGHLVGYIEISIPENKISNIYKYNVIENKILMVDSEGVVQSSIHNVELDQAYKGFEKIKNISNDNFYYKNGKIVFYEKFDPLGWYIINEIPVIHFAMPFFMLFLIALVLLCIIIVIYIYVSHKISYKLTKPLNDLTCHIRSIKDGELEPIEEVECSEEVQILLTAFNSMSQIQNEMNSKLIEAEKLKRHLSLTLLQQQIKPHFLYNTLDNIYSLAELDEKDILMELVMNLSQFYRFSLSNGKTYVTLEQELEISHFYLEIMKIRYYEKFSYEIECPKELKKCSCIKLLLQPIIENSIYHGIKEQDVYGFIRICCREKEDKIEIIVSDNGKGISEEIISKIWEEKADHFGIKNINQRIQLCYGKEYGIRIMNLIEGGCCNIITLPKRQEEKSNDKCFNS